MKKIISALILSVICSAGLLAVPAKPGRIVCTQPDGSTISIIRHGDEWGHWITDTQGRVLKKDADGFYREAGVSAGTARAAARIRRQAIARTRRAPAGKIALGQKRFLVILVEFSDLSFTTSNPKTAFSNLLNQKGYSVNGATGSARDYYYENSHGVFEPVFDVFGPVKLSKTKAYYGGNDDGGNDLYAEEAVVDGCKGLDSEINFADYDNDGDGEVDLVFMYYAGYGEADSDDEDAIWPHQWELSSARKSITLDGKRIDRYACTNELIGYGSSKGKLCGIGTACHEFGHAMGLPDFYDTDYDTNGQSAGLFTFSAMDSGSYNNDGRTPPYFNIEERILLGWLDESALRTFDKSGSVTLTTVDDNIAYKTLTDTEGEYFVYECRGSNGWDRYLDAHGLIVYHVDRSGRSVKVDGTSVTAEELWTNWQNYNAINENGSHPCFYIVPAAGQDDLMFGHVYYKDGGYYYFDPTYAPQIPFPGSKAVSSYTAKSWNGVESDVTLSSISYSSDVVTFTVKLPSAGLDYPVIANPGNGVYSAGSVFKLELVEVENNPSASVSWSFDGKSVEASSVALAKGPHTVTAAVTMKDGSSYFIELEIDAM